jgi:Lon protease-like protein
VDPTSGKLRDLAPALSALPLFPLPTVLFPGAMLPLHIFEPRYRQMIRDVLESHRALAVVLVTDPTAVDAHGHPSIAEVAGAGVIVDHAELPSGRYNVLVRGRARVRLSELPFIEPYRRAQATVMTPPAIDVPPTDLSALISAASAFTARVRERDPSFEFPLPQGAAASQIADLCAHHLVLDARERQQILETLDPVQRARRVTESLTLQRLTLSNDPRDIN